MVWKDDPSIGPDIDQKINRRQMLQGVAMSSTGLAGLTWWVQRSLADFLTAADSAANIGGFLAELTMMNGDVARVFDTNQDGRRELAIQDAGSDGIKITSSGQSTPDYGASLVNLNRRGVTLGDLENGPFAYDYKEGSDNTSAVPDEVWIVLQSAGPSSGRHAVLRTEVDDASGWNTRNVAQEIGGTFPTDGSGQPWKEFSPRDRSLTEIGDDLISRFGANTRVQAVGVGRGSPVTGPSMIETYFKDLKVPGGPVSLPSQHGR